MGKKILFSIMLLITGFLVNTPLLAMQSESPVACNEAAEPNNLVYGDHTTGCEVNGTTDLDSFNFDGTIGDVIRIGVRANGTLDGRVELFDPTGTKVVDTNCQTGSIGCSIEIDEILGMTGTYGIAVSDSGSDNTGSFTLQLEKFPPVVNTPIEYNVPVDDGVSPTTDVDLYAFNAFAGNVVRITINALGTLDGRLELYDPNGVVIIDTACQTGSLGCTVTTDQALTVDGTYQVAVSDSGIDNANNYQINIQCLVGPCPVPPTRPECDIQLSQAAYIDGETLTADVFRLANHTGASLPLEIKIWVGVTGGPLASVINSGADGSVVFPDGTDIDQGPVPLLLPFTAALPRGGWELSCRLLNPTTGRLLMEDRNFFELQ